MNDRHISDERLIELCLTGPTSTEQAHLAICARCEARRVEIVSILAELDDAATQNAGITQWEVTIAEALKSADYATALACYNSPEYQANIKVRQPHSIADLIIIEGYDGPQPSDG